MTKEYAAVMWKHYLEAMNKDRNECILHNPALCGGVYADTTCEEGKLFIESCLEESALHFHDVSFATANTLILRALRELKFTTDSYQDLISLLAELSANSYE